MVVTAVVSVVVALVAGGGGFLLGKAAGTRCASCGGPVQANYAPPARCMARELCELQEES